MLKMLTLRRTLLRSTITDVELGNVAIYRSTQMKTFCVVEIKSSGTDIPNGEDIKFKCSWKPTKRKTSDLKVVARRYTKWTRIGLNHVEYNLNQTRHIESLEQYQTESFSINLIKSEDFGVYYVWYSQIYENIIHSHLVCKFELKKSKVMTEYIQVPVGSFLILGNHIFHTFANVSDLTVVYNVKSVALGRINLTTNAISSECSYWTNIYRNYRTNNYTLSFNVVEHMVIINGGTCVSSKLYGLHYISIVRKLFNETPTSRRYIGEEEVIFRHQYLVHPGRTLLNVLYKKESNNFTENDFPSISDIIYEERMWTIRQGLEGTVIIVFILASWLLVLKLYKNVFVVASALWNFLRKVDIIEGEYCSDFIDDIEFVEDIDCLVISAENERQYNNLISSCLEEEDYIVCIPDRDFDVNGQSIKLYSQAISTALSIVIICSTDLVHDSFLNEFVITDIILNRLEDKSIREKTILIIKTDSQRLSLLECKQQQLLQFEDVKRAHRRSSTVQSTDLGDNTINTVLMCYCFEMFWDCCLLDTCLESFLNIHKDELYRSYVNSQKQTELPSVSSAPYSTSLPENNTPIITKDQWEFLFKNDENEKCLLASNGITVSCLDSYQNIFILSIVCSLFKAVKAVSECQIQISKIAALQCYFSSNEFLEIWTKMEEHIVTIGKNCANSDIFQSKCARIRETTYNRSLVQENRKYILQEALNNPSFIRVSFSLTFSATCTVM
ncbi:unnamed protein product [Mytilus edulis]|uniref:TIR domain-containing protein n=1 Tax=Mytilus edulis TaxID=6550 RepID=A0A8S3U3E5_MYTED|nr:unnamed protein product [Mytilus edulis]